MTTDSDLALPSDREFAGYVDPVIGRIARREVQGYFGFPLIKAGQPVTKSVVEKALSLGRLFELVAATEES
ncbi:MAG: hypothetical protein ACLQVD_03090 [Capsulimonadaceae bacterium]